MKSLFLIFIFTTLLVSGCEKVSYKSTGTITGSDMTLCMCCGGYFIEIEGNRYRFDKSELPSGFSFTDSQLPLQVELDWEINTAVCKGFNWIKISKIKAKL